jgi:hypothetical protein
MEPIIRNMGHLFNLFDLCLPGGSSNVSLPFLFHNVITSIIKTLEHTQVRKTPGIYREEHATKATTYLTTGTPI